jgi:ferredoxin-type protein NapH
MKRQRVRRKILFFSFLLFPVTLNYFSPALMTEGTAQGIAVASLFVWLGVFVTSLVLGRGFCGWGCPFHGLQQGWEKAADKPLRRVRFLGMTRYVLWGAWVIGVAALAVAAGGWHRIDLLYSTPNIVSVEGPQSLITYFALVGITLLPQALGRRGFCHYVCPFGAWMVVGTRLSEAAHLPRLRLRSDAAACTSCERCERECPMSLPVQAMAASGKPDHTECILCATCVDACPKKALRLGFGR